MAAVRTMMSVVREEAAIVSAEITAVARNSAVEVSRGLEMECNPSLIRQVVQTSIKEGVAGESSVIASNLSHAPINPSTLLSETLQPKNILAESQSIIGKAIDRETGVSSLREVMSNATQTGAEEQLDEAVDLAKALLDNPEIKAQVEQVTGLAV